MTEKKDLLNGIFGNELIPGDMDSLILYGSNEQGKLRNFSKSLAKITTKDQGELEYAIYDLTKAIEKFQNASQRKGLFNIGIFEKRQHSIVMKKYDEMLVYIEKITALLQLQEAQLIKDSKSLQQLSVTLQESTSSLEQRIIDGENLLKELREKENKEDLLDDWIDRLERRLDDMRVSHTVSLQSIAQADLMISNFGQLIDKIIACLTGTIPLWRNQITLLLGLEKLERNSSLQDKVSDMAGAYIAEGQKAINKYNRRKRIDAKKVEEVNGKLSQMLEDLQQLERDGEIIKEQILNTIQ